MILKFKLECRLKMKYRPFSKNVFGGERGGGKFYAPFYYLFYCTYLRPFYALLKGYFRHKNALVLYSTRATFYAFYVWL